MLQHFNVMTQDSTSTFDISNSADVRLVCRNNVLNGGALPLKVLENEKLNRFEMVLSQERDLNPRRRARQIVVTHQKK